MKFMWLAFFFLLAIPIENAHSSYPVHLTLEDFSPYGRFDRSIESDWRGPKGWSVRENGEIRPASTEAAVFFPTRQSYHAGAEFNPEPNCQVLLTDLQKTALLKMLYDGYISKKIYDQVKDAVDLWEPEQILYAYTWSPMTVKEARFIFGEIPWDRVLLDEEKRGGNWWEEEAQITFHPDWDENQYQKRWRNIREDAPIRVVRSMAMLIRGQATQFETGKLKPYPLAWQGVPAFSSLAELDREKFPLIAEVSRAFVEPGILPGNLDHPMRALLNSLRQEAKVFGVSPDRVLIFSHVFDVKRARNFANRYGGRLFDLDMKRLFEADPDTMSKNYLHAPSPGKRNADRYRDAVMVGTLSTLTEKLKPQIHSGAAHQIGALSKGTLSFEKAEELIDFYLRSVHVHFDYLDHPTPITLLNKSPVLVGLIASKVLELGIDQDDAATKVGNYLLELGQHLLDPFATYDVDQGFVLDPIIRKEDGPAGFRVSNLIPKKDPQDPHYAAKIILGIEDEIVRMMREMSDEGRGNLSKTFFELMGKPFEPRLPTHQELFNEFPIVVVTGDGHTAQNHLRGLGGEEMRVPLWSPGRMSLGYDSFGKKTLLSGADNLDGYAFFFRSDALQVLRQNTPREVLKRASLKRGKFDRYQSILNRIRY